MHFSALYIQAGTSVPHSLERRRCHSQRDAALLRVRLEIYLNKYQVGRRAIEEKPV